MIKLSELDKAICFPVLMRSAKPFYILRKGDRIMVWHERDFMDYKVAFIIKPKQNEH